MIFGRDSFKSASTDMELRLVVLAILISRKEINIVIFFKGE